MLLVRWQTVTEAEWKSLQSCMKKKIVYCYYSFWLLLSSPTFSVRRCTLVYCGKTFHGYFHVRSHQQLYTHSLWNELVYSLNLSYDLLRETRHKIKNCHTNPSNAWIFSVNFLLFFRKSKADSRVILGEKDTIACMHLFS